VQVVQCRRSEWAAFEEGSGSGSSSQCGGHQCRHIHIRGSGSRALGWRRGRGRRHWSCWSCSVGGDRRREQGRLVGTAGHTIGYRLLCIAQCTDCRLLQKGCYLTKSGARTARAYDERANFT
jgi:hypothetical protein